VGRLILPSPSITVDLTAVKRLKPSSEAEFRAEDVSFEQEIGSCSSLNRFDVECEPSNL
jgi:hypothetical protein